MAKVTIKAYENGPYLVNVDDKVLVALCRCGQSSKKPYCDGTHIKAGFKATDAEIKVLDE